MSIALEQLIAQTLEIAPDNISDELAFQGIAQWDSSRHVDLMLALEEAYGVEIDADAIVELTTVQAIRAWARAQEA